MSLIKDLDNVRHKCNPVDEQIIADAVLALELATSALETCRHYWDNIQDEHMPVRRCYHDTLLVELALKSLK